MYQRIVVGTDGSPRARVAIDHAAALAAMTGASLHVVQGCGSPVITPPMFGETSAIDPAELVSAGEAELRPMSDELAGRGLDVSVHVRTMTGQAALCDVANELGADLIVVGNRGMTGAKRLLGSVPNSVARQAPCSVLIVATSE